MNLLLATAASIFTLSFQHIVVTMVAKKVEEEDMNMTKREVWSWTMVNHLVTKRQKSNAQSIAYIAKSPSSLEL